MLSPQINCEKTQTKPHDTLQWWQPYPTNACTHTLLYLTEPYLAIPYLAIPYLVLPCLTLPYSTWALPELLNKRVRRRGLQQIFGT